MIWPTLSYIREPQDEFDRLFTQMTRAFQGAAANRRSFPRLNAWRNDDGLLLTAEIPGLDAEKLEVTVSGNRVTLAGEVPCRAAAEDETYHRSERFAGRFSRELELDYRIDAGHVQADCRDGVLSVFLPRLAEDKPKRIAVKAA